MSLIWVRDWVLHTADIGDNNASGPTTVDLLWKARTGYAIQQSIDETPLAGTLPAPGTFPRAVGGPSPRDLPAATLPEFNISGSLIKRIRLDLQLYFANKTGDTVGHHNFAVTQGHFEGILVYPYSESPVQAWQQGSFPSPASVQHSMQFDWLWWDRKYALSQGQRMYNLAVSPSPSEVAYATQIDTRCSRRVEEIGQTLVLALQSAEAFTINGWSASWSVLLDIPTA